MIGNSSGVLSSLKRRHKRRRRRSRSEETRAVKKHESQSETATCSETSQATFFTRETVAEVRPMQEEAFRRPFATLQPKLPQPQTLPTTSGHSLCYSVSESNECSTMTDARLLLPGRNLDDERGDEIESVTASVSSGSVGLGGSSSVQSISHEFGRPQEHLVSDAWSTGQPCTNEHETQEAESSAPDFLCEDLRRSLTLDVKMEVDEDVQSTSEEKKVFSDFLDDQASLPDDGLDAFADEEWSLSGEYSPAPYNVELDWEE